MTEKGLPDSWTKVALGRLGDWQGGGTPRKSEGSYWRGDIPWVSPKDMKVENIRKTRDYITPKAIEESSTKLIPENSVLLVTRSGILAHSLPVATAELPLTINQDLKAITPHHGVNPTFLAWAMRASEHRILQECSKDGTTVHSIEMPRLYDFEIALAPTKEQQRIVAKIEELFSELDNGLKNLEIARQQLSVYRQALLQRAFEGRLSASWREDRAGSVEAVEALLQRIESLREDRFQARTAEWKQHFQAWGQSGQLGPRPSKPSKLKRPVPIETSELADLPNIPESWRYVRLTEIARIGTGMSVSRSRKLADPIEVPYLRVANVQRGYLDLDEIKTMDIERTQLPRLRLETWDVLFNEGGDRDKLGRGWVWQSQLEPCITQNHVFRASPFVQSELHSKWISYWGNSFGQRYFDRQGKQTTNLASINKTVLSCFPVPLPPIEEQKQIIQILEAQSTIADRLDDEINSSIEGLISLRQAILERAFQGRLVPQDPTDDPASDLLERIQSEGSASNNSKKRKTGT